LQFADLIHDRYSVRSFKQDKVEREKLDVILEAGRVAPSAGNKRPHKLIVVQSEDGRKKIDEAADAFGAPLLIIACIDSSQAGIRDDGRNYADVDNGIIVDHMMLQASALDLGTLWIGGFEPGILKEAFNIPDSYEPLSILAIGYVDGKPLSREEHTKKYKSLDEIVVYETM
jgi:nitroreductase